MHLLAWGASRFFALLGAAKKFASVYSASCVLQASKRAMGSRRTSRGAILGSRWACLYHIKAG